MGLLELCEVRLCNSQTYVSLRIVGKDGHDLGFFDLLPFADFDLPWGVAMLYRQDEARVHVLAAIDAIVAHAKELSPAKSPEAVLPASHTSKLRIS